MTGPLATLGHPVKGKGKGKGVPRQAEMAQGVPVG